MYNKKTFVLLYCDEVSAEVWWCWVCHINTLLFTCSVLPKVSDFLYVFSFFAIDSDCIYT